jgi:hypothetical protein
LKPVVGRYNTLAAESHVDRSILSPLDFVYTNVIGTVNLLNAAKQYWGGRIEEKFYHVSTDDVWALGSTGFLPKKQKYDRIRHTAHQGVVGSFCKGVSRYLWASCGSQQLFQQLRTQPFS